MCCQLFDTSCCADIGYAELKQHTRTGCSDQGREPYVPPPHDHQPCYDNEYTCTEFYNSSGMGRSINITYEWKQFMYENYDRWLYNRRAQSHLAVLSSGLDRCMQCQSERCLSLTRALDWPAPEPAAQGYAHAAVSSKHH